LKGRSDVPLSWSENITLRNINIKCEVFFDVEASENYRLSHFTFENLNIESGDETFDRSLFSGIEFKNVRVNNNFIR